MQTRVFIAAEEHALDAETSRVELQLRENMFSYAFLSVWSVAKSLLQQGLKTCVVQTSRAYRERERPRVQKIAWDIEKEGHEFTQLFPGEYRRRRDRPAADSDPRLAAMGEQGPARRP